MPFFVPKNEMERKEFTTNDHFTRASRFIRLASRLDNIHFVEATASRIRLTCVLDICERK